MLRTDGTHQFAMSKDGYFIGQPLQGAGTFGDWSLARAQIVHEKFHTITLVRELSDDEVAIILSHPIMYWFVLATPQCGHAWALMRCRYDPHATDNSFTTPVHRNKTGGGSLV